MRDDSLPLPDRCIEAALLPTDEDVATFQKTGWWLSPPLFSDAELDAAIALQDRFYAGERHPGADVVPKRRPAHALRKNDNSSFAYTPLRLITHKTQIAACAARLLGCDAIRLWHDQLLYKPPLPRECLDEAQVAVGWHADRNYWQTCTGPLVTAWVPFTAITRDMGPIAFIEGSQDWELIEDLDFFNSDLTSQENMLGNRLDRTRIATPTFRRGQVSFHDWRTVHGSAPNRSDRPRRSMAVHLQAGQNAWTAWYQPDGQLRRHANDALVRRDPAGRPDYHDPEWCPVLWPVPGEPAQDKAGKASP